jgi:hypothetical protein
MINTLPFNSPLSCSSPVCISCHSLSTYSQHPSHPQTWGRSTTTTLNTHCNRPGQLPSQRAHVSAIRPVTEVPVQCHKKTTSPRTQQASSTCSAIVVASPSARPASTRQDQTCLACPHEIRHRNWVWGGLSRFNATTPRPGLDDPWPAIHRVLTVLYCTHPTKTKTELDYPKKPTPTTPTPAPGCTTYSSGTLELSPKQNCPPAPQASKHPSTQAPKHPRLSPAGC